MRLLILMLLCNYGVFTQTLLKYDNIETYTWSGVWWNLTPGGYYTNAKVSGTSSAAIYGAGNGTSVVEQNWYSMPNVTGLNSAYQYEFRFRLGSYWFSNSTATTKGVDAADLVEVQVSRDGELTYTSELRITGFNNSNWDYNSVGIINHTADGVFNSTSDTYTSASGNNTTLSTGYSVIKLKITGITQIAVDILARVNSAGEEWWIDNVELWQITNPLPVEIIEFNGVSDGYRNKLYWSTASEIGSDRFEIERSLDGYVWSNAGTVNASGNSNELRKYSFNDILGSYYYRLIQYDFDGNFEVFGPIYVANLEKEKYILKIVDMSGRDVGDDYEGPRMVIYSDGSILRIF